MNRREFIATMTLGFTAEIALASCDRSQGQTNRFPKIELQPFTSGEITRLAIIREATALALQDPQPALMQRLLKGTAGLPSILGMGMMFPESDLDGVSSFLAKARSNILDFRTNEQDRENRVAIATGYLMHWAIARRIQDRLATAKIDAAEQNTAKLYQDAEVIRNSLDAPPSKTEARNLLSVIDRRMRIKMHTLRPDGSDEKAWVLKLLEWDTAQENFINRLASAIGEPEFSQRNRYVTALNFGDRFTNHTADRGRTILLSSSVQPDFYEASLADCRQIVTLVAQFIDGTISDTTFGQKINSL